MQNSEAIRGLQSGEQGRETLPTVQALRGEMAARSEATSVVLDASHHVYHAGDLNGPIVPGVTEILRRTGLSDDYRRVPMDVLERARQRGTAVHAAIHYDGEGDLGTIDPEVAPYLESWRRFCADTGWVTVEHERILHYEEGGVVLYAGRADAIGHFGGQDAEVPTVLDLSLGDLDAGAKAIQCSAYSEAYRQRANLSPDIRIARVGVRLSADGYRVEHFRDWKDFRVFRSALHVFAHRYDQ